MKARLTEQYDLTCLTKREMEGLMVALRTFCREFTTTPVQDELLLVLEDAYQGSSEGVGVNPIADDDDDEDDTDDDGGALVPSEGRA